MLPGISKLRRMLPDSCVAPAHGKWELFVEVAYATNGTERLEQLAEGRDPLSQARRPGIGELVEQSAGAADLALLHEGASKVDDLSVLRRLRGSNPPSHCCAGHGLGHEGLVACDFFAPA
jgi:hypothetical protein